MVARALSAMPIWIGGADVRPVTEALSTFGLLAVLDVFAGLAMKFS
jgi:hypothetical protein